MKRALTNLKRIVAILVIFCLMFSLIPASAFAAGASDISGHWAQVTIQSWMDQGLIKGYPDGTFKPDQNVTRAEFMTLANRAFGYTAVVPITYTDVKAGSWYAPEVAKAKAAGYISGYPDGTMKPENPITREEVATIVARIKNLTSDANAADKYTDAAKIGSWSKGQVGAVTSAKIMQGYPDGSFMPQGLMTRAEVVVASDNALHYTASVANIAVSAITVTPTTMALTAGGATGAITATVSPSNATNKIVTWSSSKAAVAIVAGGVVTPIAAGAAVITATTVDGAFTATCTVTVTAPVVSGGSVPPPVVSGGSAPAPTTYTVTFDSQGGTAVTAITGIAYGAAVTLPTAPTKAGNTFVSWNTAAAGTGGTFTASTAVTANVTVYAQWTAALSRDATLKASSTVKGETLLSLGRSSASGDIFSDGGKVTITAAEAANTTNLTSYITLFDPTDARAIVKVVKFSQWSNNGNFDSASAYANQLITDQDYFWVKVTAPDTTTLYYKVNVTVTPAPLTNETQLRTALANTHITTISLGTNIGLTSPLTISRTVTIDGLDKSIGGISGNTITISGGTGTVTLKNMTLTGTANYQALDGNYGIWVQSGTLIADNINMTVATNGTAGTDNDGFNVASGASLDLRNSTITLTGTTDNQHGVYAQSGAVAVTLNNNTFSFPVRTTSPYSYLISMQGATVANYPTVTLTGTNANNAYIKLLLVGADTLANKQGYAAAKVATGERLGVMGSDQGIYTRTATGWTIITEAQLRAALAGSDTTITLGTNIGLTSPLIISRDVTIDGLGKSITGNTITITAGTVTLKNVTLTGTENVQTDGNYGIMIQGGSLVADSIHMTVVTNNANDNDGFNVASGASLDLSNSLITITSTHQQYAVYAQSGAGPVTLTNNTFSFNASNTSGAYSYLIGMQGAAVGNYPVVTLTGTNTNNAYMKLLLVGADTLANKEGYAETGNRVAVGERLGIMLTGTDPGPDGGIYYRLVGSWVK